MHWLLCATACATHAAAANATWCSPHNVDRHLAGGCVLSLRPALPRAAASRLSALLESAWRGNSFLYATNCLRTGDTRGGGHSCACGNTKRRMKPADASEAQAAALFCKNKRGFTYSKYELDRQASAHASIAQAVHALLPGPLGALLDGPVSNLTDWFASAFERGGWLGQHSDLGLGHVAFVLNLTPDSNPFRGGDLEFAEGHKVAPRFNSLTAFRVGAGAHPLRHRVTTVDAPPGSPPRLALTGWYTVPGGDPQAVSPSVLAAEKR